MIGVLLIFLFVTSFYRAAKKVGQNKWLWSAIGLGVMLITVVVSSFLSRLIDLFLDYQNPNVIWFFTVVQFAFIIAVPYTTLYFMKKHAVKKEIQIQEDILDQFN